MKPRQKSSLGLPRFEEAPAPPPEIQAKLHEQNQQLLDRYITSLTGLWGATLTVNGFVLAFFSLEAGPGGRLRGLVFALAMAGAACVVLNFMSMQSNYYRLGRANPTLAQLNDEQWKERERKKMTGKQWWVRFRTHAAVVLLALEALALAAIQAGVTL